MHRVSRLGRLFTNTCRNHHHPYRIQTRAASFPNRFSKSSPKFVLGIFPDHDLEGVVNSTFIRCEDLCNQLLELPPGSPRVLSIVDDISNEVCRVTDALELLRHVYPDPEMSERATQAHVALSEYIFSLNARPELYQALKAAVASTSNPAAQQHNGSDSGCTKELARMGQLMLAEFERGGIGLPQAAREKMQKLQVAELQLCTVLGDNIRDIKAPTASIPAEVLRGLSSADVSVLRECKVRETSAELVVGIGSANYDMLMMFLESSAVKKAIYIANHTTLPENAEVLRNLLGLRAEVASILGHPSYEHLSATTLMAKHPDNIQRFLTDVHSHVRPYALQDVAKLTQLRDSALPYNLASHGSGGVANAAPLQSWDVSYFLSRYKRSAVTENLRDVQNYLSLENCFNALGALVRSLFGIEMAIVAPQDCRDEIWHSSVQKVVLRRLGPDEYRTLDPEGPVPPLPVVRAVDVCEDDENFLGVCYLDLLQRDKKTPHAAHYTVRCGRRPAYGTPQTPIVALVFSFQELNQMSMSEVETLFHEFGHALHSLLSRTETQHLSGTRSRLDFVETPSQLFEYFVWDERTMALFARHPVSKQPMPLALRRAARQSKLVGKSFSLVTQLYYAAADFELHCTPKEMQTHPSWLRQTVRRAQEKFDVLPVVEDIHWETKFAHLAWYGGGYYSYLWCQVLASSIWQTCLKENPLDIGAGQHLEKYLLRPGGSVDPTELMQNTIGGEASLDAWAQNELGV